VIRVLVAASSAVARAGLEAILARDPSLVIVGGERPNDAVTLAEEIVEHEPDVVVMELTALRDEEPLAAVRFAAGEAFELGTVAPSIVVLTDEADPVRHVAALELGVRALLPRTAAAAAILAAVTGAAAGIISIAAEWGRELLRDDRIVRPAALSSGDSPAVSAESNAPATLTGRELEVLRMIADGLANKQIAVRLGISEHTVKFHVGSLFMKLRSSTRAEAVMIGARRGLIVL
jgi:DNA-binding NarL/FixJ family response regulator